MKASQLHTLDIGTSVSFVYNDKTRFGKVENVDTNPRGDRRSEPYVTLALADGGYKNFNLSKIQGEVTLTD